MSELLQTAKSIKYADNKEDALYLIRLCERSYSQYQLNQIKQLVRTV